MRILRNVEIFNKDFNTNKLKRRFSVKNRIPNKTKINILSDSSSDVFLVDNM